MQWSFAVLKYVFFYLGDEDQMWCQPIAFLISWHDEYCSKKIWHNDYFFFFLTGKLKDGQSWQDQIN